MNYILSQSFICSNTYHSLPISVPELSPETCEICASKYEGVPFSLSLLSKHNQNYTSGILKKSSR